MKSKSRKQKRPVSMSITIDRPNPVIKDSTLGYTRVEVECTVTGGTVVNNGVKAVTSSTGGMIPTEPLGQISSTKWRGLVALNADPITNNFFVDAIAEFQCPGDSTHPSVVKPDG